MVDYDDLNKPDYKPKFLSEYSMGALDFGRYNEWLKYIEHWSAEINSTADPTLEMVQHLFSGLVNLYDCWRPIMAVKPVIEQLDKKIKDAKTKKRLWESNRKTGIPTSPAVIRELVDTLNGIKTRLMEIKQYIGLGIVVRKNISIKEKIRKGMSSSKKPDFENLPEP